MRDQEAEIGIRKRRPGSETTELTSLASHFSREAAKVAKVAKENNANIKSSRLRVFA
jgi:hypothetical protein